MTPKPTAACPTCWSDDPNVRKPMSYWPKDDEGECAIAPCDNDVYHATPAPEPIRVQVDPNQPRDVVTVRGQNGSVDIAVAPEPERTGETERDILQAAANRAEEALAGVLPLEMYNRDHTRGHRLVGVSACVPCAVRAAILKEPR